ncbi:MAG: RsmB/NOP family class I SAM-dependent RNA methyltransferase [Candidatus Marinimicrobia bacterium]|nr:RsmB/NOP family class I SAM-dependent RNA methyltransferase [Candidatus Neomarinimicrobiota bacterium]
MRNLPLLLSHSSELFSLWYNKELSLRAADKIKRYYFSERRYLGSRDRKFIENLYFDMIRNLRLYDWQIKRSIDDIEEIPAEMFTIHAYKRNFSKDDFISEFKLKDKIAEYFENYDYQNIYPEELEIRWSLPQVVWDHIKDHYSREELETCLPAMLESPGVHLRTNILKITTPDLMEKLANTPFSLGSLSSEALRLDKYSNLTQNPAFKKGLFDLQDESSQLVALICNPKKDDIVIDICAGAGGKTLHLAALQGDQPTLIATDKYPNRLKELVIRAKRLGIRNIKLTPIDKIRSFYKGKADILLIDAPCSGTGVYGRHPDRKWELTEERLSFYINEQSSILNKNAHLVKEGGSIVYATCSIIPEENIVQVDQFLESHPEFKLVSVYDDLKEHAIRIPDHNDKYLQILPHHFQSDGFFIAKMKRVK